jgi:hypothetical protein
MTYYENTVDDAKIQAILDQIHCCGFDIDDGRPTGETLDTYRENSKTWHQRGEFTERVIDGITVLEFVDAQAVKGQRRQTVVVLDLGEFRAVFAA